MSAEGSHKRPIIIIKRSAGHDDEHGGAWKIAYADFVTAMMAFFLVMWLLSSVSDKQRRGIAQYFSAASIMDLRNGSGLLDGSRSALNGADSQMVPMNTTKQDTPPGDDDPAQVVHSAPVDTDNEGMAPAAGQTSGPSTGSGANNDRVEAQRLDAARAELERMTQAGELKQLASNISVQMTPEGLRVQIFDRDGEPMFLPGAAEPNRRLITILDALMPVLNGVKNGVIITGHTDAQPLDKNGYSNWELSADRANATRRYLEGHGMDGARFFKVEGRSSADPLLPQSPADPRNRRIALTLLRADAAAQMQSPAPAAGSQTTSSSAASTKESHP